MIPGSGRSPGEGNGNPLQYSFLENSLNRGSWRTIIHGVAESDMIEQLTHTHTEFFVKCKDWPERSVWRQLWTLFLHAMPMELVLSIVALHRGMGSLVCQFLPLQPASLTHITSCGL